MTAWPLLPREPVYSIKRRDSGTPVWAVQRALNAIGDQPRIAEDGDFGRRTDRAVERYQEWNQLGVDGVFGPATSHAMSVDLQDLIQVPLPDLLLEGQIEMESGALIAATNWNVPGGVDCSYMQRRVYEGDYSDVEVIKRAFDGRYQINLAARTTAGRHDRFMADYGQGNENAWRLAVAYWNYPYGAEKTAQGIWPNEYSTSPQGWVMQHNLKFPDGHSVRTPTEWLQRYSLGNMLHAEPGQMVKYVTDWRAIHQ